MMSIYFGTIVDEYTIVPYFGNCVRMNFTFGFINNRYGRTINISDIVFVYFQDNKAKDLLSNDNVNFFVLPMSFESLCQRKLD